MKKYGFAIGFIVIFFVGSAIAENELLIKSTGKYQLWGCYPPEKFGLYEKPSVDQRGEGISITAAKGEHEPFLIVVRPTGAETVFHPRFEISDMVSDSGAVISSSQIVYYLVNYLYIDVPSTSSVTPEIMKKAIPDYKSNHLAYGGTGRVGHYPDILIPSDSWQINTQNVFAGENSQFWFRIYIPRDTAAGIYKGAVTFKARGQEARIPLEVKVYDFELPKRSPLRVTACNTDFKILKNLWKFEDFKNHYRTLVVDYKQTGLDPIYPMPKLKVVGDVVKVDAKEWERMLRYCLDELKINQFFFPVRPEREMASIFNWGSGGTIKNAKWFGFDICDDQYNLTDEFKKAFGSYLKQTLPILKKNGWLDNVYVHSIDEPRCYEDFLFISNWCDFLLSVEPEMKMMLKTNYPFPEDFPEEKIVGKISLWGPNNSWDEDFWKRRIKAGDEFAFYTNWLLFPSDWPIVNPRLLGWISWRTGAVGYFHGVSDNYPRYLVYMNGIKFFGVHQMLYYAPLEPKLYPSIRLEMEREGFEDYHYLSILKQKLAELKEKGIKSGVVTEAEKFLETVTDEVIPNAPFMTGKTWLIEKPFYTTSNRVVVELRNRAAELIEKLQSQPLGDASGTSAKAAVSADSQARVGANEKIKVHKKLIVSDSEDVQQAIKAYKKAIALNPNNAQAYYKLGVEYEKLKRYKDAIKACSKAVKIAPGHAGAHFTLGISYFSVGNTSAALKESKILKTLDEPLAEQLFYLIYP